MRTVLLASLRHNRRRYVASALAVVIGVAFIVATNGLAGSLRSGMTADVAVPFSGSEHVLSQVADTEVAAIERAATSAGAETTVVRSGWVNARVGDARVADTFVGTFSEVPRMQWQEVLEGRSASREGEVLVGERFAVRHGVEVGDEVSLGDVQGAVVGVVDDPSMGGYDLHLRPSDAEAAQLSTDVVLVSGGLGWLDEPALDAARDSGLVRWTTEEYVVDQQAQITRGVDVIAMMVSIFAAIALMVAVLVITNTFAILFAQRARDFALLRCVGVTRAQLRRSVRVEAFVLGIMAALVGVAVGVALAAALARLASLRFDVMGPAGFEAGWIVGAFAVGVLVTVVAAWLPTRAVTRISPLAALRPTGGVDPKSRAGVLRVLAGLLVLLTGVVTLSAVVHLTGKQDGPDATPLLLAMLAGGSLAFVGVLLLGPLLVPALVRAVGRLAQRRGPAGAVVRLATSNSVRNPRRTATTAASLMVGVTLTTAVLAGVSSLGVTVDGEMEESYPLDVSAVPFAAPDATTSAALERAAAAVTEAGTVAASQVVPGGQVELGGNAVLAVAVSQSEPVLRAGGADRFADADVLVDGDTWFALPEGRTDDRGHEVFTLTGPLGSRDVVVGINDAYGAETVAVRPEVLAGVLTPQPVALWVRAEDGADSADLVTDVTQAVVAQGVAASVGGDYQTRDFIGTQFDVVTGAVVGLLGIAVLIALIGIGNTLGLSILERARENALLRAMGYTKQQLRRTLAWEGVLLAVVATVLGVAIGLAFAWVGVEVLVGAMSVETDFTVPLWQVGAVVVVAVLSAVLASVAPSRRAGRVSPAEGLALQ